MKIDEIIKRARLDRAPMRVRALRLTDQQYDALTILARRHGLKVGAMLRAVVDELLAGAAQEDHGLSRRSPEGTEPDLSRRNGVKTDGD